MYTETIKLTDKFHILQHEMIKFLLDNKLSLYFILKNANNIYLIRKFDAAQSEIKYPQSGISTKYIGYMLYIEDDSDFVGSQRSKIIIEFLD